MAEVVSLHGADLPPNGEPVPALVEMCEDLLERVRSGEIIGVALAGVYRDFGTSLMRGGHVTYGQVGILAHLQKKLLQDLE